MQFTLALAMCPPERLLPLARTAEAAGWDAVAIPDSVFYPETVSASYPFTPDGKRFWPADAPFVDPLVAMPAIAAATERLTCMTNVLKTPLREPLLVAKAVGSMAAVFPGRIALGVGLSWIPEEFAWLGQEMSTRGKRLDEQIEVVRKLLAGGWVEHHGPHYDFDRLRMEPAPPGAVPILVGGHSDAALGRAARLGDGWIGAQASHDDLAALIGRLHVELDRADRPTEGYEVHATPLVPATPEAMAALADAGLTGVITVPWYFRGGGDPNDASFQDESIHWFAETVIAPMREAVAR
ncbi:MAG TPA: TIGR03619 family F420-dependent LLM class oxidoreductase [Aquihabitans sp.]|nr:TIGR03619 family F420-dependent LLM class oxidoreductase [Aquihabitans sp.]